MSGCTWGSIMWALKRASAHPLPNSNGSRCGFTSSQFLNVSIAHSLACMMPGPPVRRGPNTSLNQLMWSMTSDRFIPSSRIFAIIARSSFSDGACARGSAAMAVISNRSAATRFMDRSGKAGR